MSELKAAARSWFDQGFNVVAFRFKIDDEGELSKQPLIEWSKWKSQRQTLEEFENQPWSISDAFGIVCGYPNAEGLYLAVVDYDVKKVSEDAKKRGEKLLERFPITRIERTISGGLHYVYFSRVKPNLISETHDSCALELIAGPSKLCVMAPSKGYKTLNDNPPRVVEDAEELFREIVKLPDPRKAKIGAESRGKLEKWLKVLKEHLDVAGEGSNYIYAHCPFHPPDKHPSFAINKVKFYAVDYHDGEVFSLKDLGEKLGVDLPGEKGENNLNLYELAQQIISESPIKTDIRTFLMYRWNGRYWTDDAEGYIQKRLVKVEGEGYKPYHLKSLIEIIQGETFVNSLEEPPANLINLENGVLNLETGELIQHDPRYFFRNMIHAAYNPEAKAEKFQKWLKEILPDEESRTLIQEIAGYCLLRDYPLHHIFFLVGSGRNGKGTLLRTLESILGKENCVSIPLERLGERFQNTNLIGKLLNVVSEPKITLISTEPVKAATGQDLLHGEVKNRQKPIIFQNYAKIIVMANRLPPVSDSTLAWWERVVIVEFPIVIPEEKRIQNIEHIWLNDLEERGGILNWMLEGLRRLMKNGRFTKPERMKKAIEDYRKWSDPIQYFISKYCIIDGKSITPKANIYDAYKTICNLEDLKVTDERELTAGIKKQPYIKEKVMKIAGRAVRCWLGLRLNTEEIEKIMNQNEQPVTEVTDVTYFSNSEKCDKQAELKQKEEAEFFKKYKKSVTSVTGEPSGARIDVYKCGDCGFWAANRCGLRREWVVVLPNHPACGSFKPRGAADGADSL